MANKDNFVKGILKRRTWDLPESEVTPESVFKSRRQIIKALGLGAAGAGLSTNAQAGLFDVFSDKKAETQFKVSPLTFTKNDKYQTSEILTPETKVTTHNNFFEFGTSKADPVNNAQGLSVDPWKLVVDGEVETPLTLGYDDLFKLAALEERTYRLRCVEAWSMVIPWVGFSLANIIKKANPTSKAKYVAFETLVDPNQMPGQRNRFVGGGIDYPYVEGLTLPEAMNDLSFLSVGLYGKTLPPQNGAPIRLIVPWKYGFKSIKSIVRIRLTDKKPPTSWNRLASHEYGFYANVNPEVDHPRWSQATERRIGAGGLFSAKRIATLPFNGYGDQVASLYTGLDLRENF